MFYSGDKRKVVIMDKQIGHYPRWKKCTGCDEKSLREIGKEYCECGAPIEVFQWGICGTTVHYEQCDCSEEMRNKLKNKFTRNNSNDI